MFWDILAIREEPVYFSSYFQIEIILHFLGFENLRIKIVKIKNIFLSYAKI